MPRTSHGLAHACVCVAVLFSWAMPGGLGGPRAPVSRAPARPSGDDADELLQRAASKALGGRGGTVVVLDAQTGRVRALVNPRVAFEEATPPGSAIKPFTMLAALRSEALGEDSRSPCRGVYDRAGFKIACAHPRHKTAFGPAQALANSCNYFFARTAEALAGDAYARTLTDFGFGSKTRGAQGEGEAAGLLPREKPGVPEMLGESESLQVTPAQLASAYAALFNGGRLLAPRRERAEGFAPRERARVEIDARDRALLLAGMRGSVAYGTAARAGLATLPLYIFGKTGTSTPRDDWRSQGWFVGLAADESRGDEKATPEKVRLAVLVFLKRSRGSEAAEVARPVFEAYARTLARGEDSAPAARASGGDEDGARPSSSGGEGMPVRVRLSREDVTLTLAPEDYVFGVLAAEGSVETEVEALKALAVSARTYARKNLRRHARDNFDLCDTTHCQRFTPVADESARPDFYELARRAVRETGGEVLLDARGRAAESYFSASCGGRTADVAKLWGVREAPAHLRGVRDDFCGGAAAPWTDVIPSARLAEALAADGRSDVGARLDGVRVLRRDASGRAELLSLEGGRRRLLSGWDFKIIVGRTLGWNVLKSSRFEVARAGTSYVFRGTGFGHGLGLCQTGAHVMASRGASYRQIIQHYFPGAGVGSVRLRDADFGLRIDESGAVRHSDLRAPSDRRAPSPVESYDSQANFQHADFPPASLRPASSQHVASQQVGSRHTVFQPAGFRPQLTATASFNTPRRPIRNPQSAIRNRELRNPQFLSSEHFRVSYPARAPRREIEAVLRTLEEAHADVSRRLAGASLGAALPNTEVVVYETTGDFVGTTGRPAWVAATTTGRRIELQPVDVLRRRGVLAATLRHEFVHAALEALSRGRAPRWLVEGLAVHVAGEGRALARHAPKRPPSLDELERRLERPGSRQEMRELYAAAYAEVGNIIRREGEAGAWRRAAR